ncbi:hypothetical protein V7S43_016050 [Phytophthora oleae]|uniref:Uncharacterized protein n=1 Tax=Phytophthora oleae TaxID=2107226 RepID=A0ABD3F194_9STRA
MSSSVLYPPNLNNFSDDIIGQVILRSTPSSYTHSTLNIHKDEGVPTTVKEESQMQTTIRKKRQLQCLSLDNEYDLLAQARAGLSTRQSAKESEKESPLNLKEHQSTMESSNVTEGEPLAMARSQVQKGFLYAVLAPNVIGLSGFGVEKLLDDYRALAFCLPSMITRLVRLTTGPGGSIHATTKVEIVITENTLRLVFPHLILGGTVSPLASKLLGQRVVMRGSTHFEWDSGKGRVSLLQEKEDLLTPMLERLGGLEMVSSVFKNALITPECTPTRSNQ